MGTDLLDGFLRHHTNDPQDSEGTRRPMTIKLGLHMCGWGDRPVPDALVAARELGYDGVELAPAWLASRTLLPHSRESATMAGSSSSKTPARTRMRRRRHRACT